MVWTILILIPKGNTDNQGIGILEVLWKVMEDIIDTRIKKAVESHDAPVRQTLQDVAEGRVPNEGGNSPLGTWKMNETCGTGPIHVKSCDYTYQAGMENIGPHPQG